MNCLLTSALKINPNVIITLYFRRSFNILSLDFQRGSLIWKRKWSVCLIASLLSLHVSSRLHWFGRWVQSGLSQSKSWSWRWSLARVGWLERKCVPPASFQSNAPALTYKHTRCHIFKGEESLPFPLRLLPLPLSVPRSWKPFTDQQESGQQRTRQIAPLLTNDGTDEHSRMFQREDVFAQSVSPPQKCDRLARSSSN